MNSETIALIVSLLYGIPSFVLYALILFQMIRPKYRKTFSNAFFRLCFAIGVVDCLGYLGFYIFFTLPMYSITSPIFGSSLFAPSAFTTGISFTLFVLLFLQIIGNCFLTLNRFTAVVIPFRHDKIWRFFFPISVVVTIVVSIAMCWEASTATVLYSPLDGGYVLTQAIPNPGISFRILMTVFITCLLCLLLNAISAIFLVSCTSLHSVGKLERNFFFMALIIFMVQGIHGIHELLFFIGLSTENVSLVVIMNSMLPWLTDLKFLSPPWIFLIFSASIRRIVVQALPKRLSSTNTPVININANTYSSKTEQ
ncbi:hypothetical protein QR680_008503 [Steinernema hermaphroditum]|uniref:Serpentine receptor class gamma n=1 Tax=Steinernema hermaphroditum TaxID=289476 RepID=A0AA39IGU6_9BILA|nr:hypothetical protein QR680_008503 [Steinernema hermaphroditum]